VTLKDRNPRSGAEHLAIDMSKTDVEIQRKLRARWPRVVDLWWELEPDEKSGWVYNGARVLAKLIHCTEVAS
jgi:hypothetical protein